MNSNNNRDRRADARARARARTGTFPRVTSSVNTPTPSLRGANGRAAVAVNPPTGRVSGRTAPNRSRGVNRAAKAPSHPARPEREVRQIREVRRRRKPRTSVLAREREPFAKFDMPLFVIVLILAVFGLGMLLSASHSFALREHGDSYHFFNLQLVFMAVGIGIAVLISYFNYRLLLNRWVLLALVGGSLALMLAVQFSDAAVTQGGAERWITLFGVTFQPSEILKFALIVVLAWMTHKYPERIKTFGGAFRIAFVIGIACLLTIIQPHLSGTVIMLAIGLSLMTISGCKLRWVGLLVALIIIAAAFTPAIMESFGFTYSDARFTSWRNPFEDIQGDTFQTFQSLVAIGSGGWFGLGFDNSRQKFSYLPAAHNDFIFSVIVEELGFVGGIAVLMLFTIFVLRGFYIASRAPDRFGAMLAAGITAQIGIQAFLNIAVATNTVPNTGVSLPFFSYGGTALIMQLAQIGVLLNISRKARVGFDD
ncbi:MAG: putative lipid II flippase FtsW [Oscillospiraceae bacterium]|nr:putative lipid II flippase FtsW [Oscillospiraceae bacterium]